MSSRAASATELTEPGGLRQLVGRERVLFTALIATIFLALFSLGWESGLPALLWRTYLIAGMAMLAYGVFEQWPRRFPRWLARWVAQVVAVALAIPVTTFLIYVATTPAGQPPFWQEPERVEGFFLFVVPGVLFGPWFALGALVRRKDAIARHQALAFELQRSELERRAVDARLRLLQAQVAPHFLFNTLANIRELVASGSDRAPAVLDSLIRYLRASVPRLGGTRHTLGEELASVRAYLELMEMRIPDRLAFSITAEEGSEALTCAPTLLLTLVENAVRHGIDPSEEGGRITVQVTTDGAQVRARVADTGVGLPAHGGGGTRGAGTGLAALRERLSLLHGDRAGLTLVRDPAGGAVAEVHWPAERPE